MPSNLTDDLKKFSPCEIKKQIDSFNKELKDLFNLEARKQEIENAIENLGDQIEGLALGIENRIEDQIEYYEKGIQDGIDTIRGIPEGIQDGIDTIRGIPDYFEEKTKELEDRLKAIEDELRKPCDE